VPLLLPEAYGTLGVTHDHPLLGALFTPETRVFELHFEGAYVLSEGACGLQHEYTDVRVRVAGWRDARFEAEAAQPFASGVDSAALPLLPFDPRIERIAEVYELDLTPNVRLSGWLVFAPHESMRWYTITFEGASVMVTYAQTSPLEEAPPD